MTFYSVFARPSAFLFLFVSGLVLAGAAGAKPGPEVYGAHARVSQLRISPEGGYVAMIANLNDQDVISISKVGGGHCNVGNGGSNLRGIYWGNENRLIVVATKTTKLPDDYGSHELYEFGQSFTMSASCGDIKQVKGLSLIHI